MVQVRAKIRDRLYAFELLMDRRFGKPEQGVTIEDERPRLTGEETMARIMELLPRVICGATGGPARDRPGLGAASADRGAHVGAAGRERQKRERREGRHVSAIRYGAANIPESPR